MLMVQPCIQIILYVLLSSQTLCLLFNKSNATLAYNRAHKNQQMSIAGVRYGPPGSRRLVYFVDDMNMPFVDKYDTQSAIELLRQSIDYKGWFDKVTYSKFLNIPSKIQFH